MKKLSKYFGLIYFLILILIIGLGNLYIDNIPLIFRGKITPVFIDTVIKKSADDLPTIKGAVTPPIDINKEIITSPEKISKGKTLYETNCVACHGAEGKGDGIAGKSMNPLPRNFTDLNGWKNGTKFSQIYLSISEGLLKTGMPQFNTLTPSDRFAIVHYIRNFRNDFPSDSPNELKAFDVANKFSSGYKQPNQIPVKSAEKILINEKMTDNKRINVLLSKINNNKSDKGAEIIKRISKDLNRTLFSIFSYAKWNENQVQFVNFMTTDLVQKGLRANVSSLSTEEWNELFNYLNNLFKI